MHIRSYTHSHIILYQQLSTKDAQPNMVVRYVYRGASIIVNITGKTPCKYGPDFAPYLHDWTLYGINTVQKWVCIYMAFFLCM